MFTLVDSPEYINEGDMLTVELYASDPNLDENLTFNYTSSCPMDSEAINWTPVINNSNVFTTKFTFNSSYAEDNPSSDVANPPSNLMCSLEFEVEDETGLKNYTTANFTFNRKPAATISNSFTHPTLLQSFSSYNGSYVIYVNTSDNDDLQSCSLDYGDGNVNLSLDCGGNSFYEHAFGHEYAAIDIYDVYFNVTDTNGAMSSLHLAADYYDITRPEPSITSPAEGVSLSPSFDMSYSISDTTNGVDAGTVDYCGYFVSNMISELEEDILFEQDVAAITYLPNCNSGTVSLSGFSDGSYNITLFAVDSMNWPGYDTVNFDVDATAPEVQLTLNPSDTSYPSTTTDIDLEIESQDALSGVKYINWTLVDTVTGSLVDNDSISFEFADLDAIFSGTLDVSSGNNYRVTANSIDDLGNVGTASRTFDIKNE